MVFFCLGGRGERFKIGGKLKGGFEKLFFLLFYSFVFFLEGGGEREKKKEGEWDERGIGFSINQRGVFSLMN